MGVERIGKIHYIEPTNISESRDDIMEGNNYVSPLEDYCISVELEILYSKRESCGMDEPIKVVLSTNEQTLSLFNGTSGVLTTNFTDIDYKNPENNTSECVGIESISISYEMSSPAFAFSPIVHIRFVDVRGASFMSKKEVDTASKNLLESLFTYPYPQFNLYIKGFYGRQVKYGLTLSKSTGIEFDSSTGNFNLDAEFIGNMYGIYNDIPMQYISVAPFMSYFGSDYWDEQVGNGTFVLDNGGEKVEMIKFPEFRLRLAKAANSQYFKKISKSNDDNLGDIESKKNAIDKIIYSYPFNTWNKEEKNEILFKIDSRKRFINEFNILASEYLNQVKDFDKIYSTNLYDSFNILKDFKKKIKFLKIERKNNEFIAIEGNFDNYQDSFNSIFDDIKGYLNSYNDTIFYLFLIQEENELEEANALRDSCDAKVNEIKINFLRAKNQYLTNILGFPPTIKNIFRMVFAHMDTFMHVFEKCMENIKAKINDGDDSRTFRYFGTDISDTDAIDCQFFPPFTLFNEKYSSDGEDYYRTFWPGKLTNGNEMDEVLFVESLIGASTLYLKENVYADVLQSSGNTNSYDTISVIDNQDIRLSVYLTLKTIYDRWVSFNIGNRWKLQSFNENSSSDFNKFIFIDSFYNDIGDILLTNPQEVSDMLSKYFPNGEMGVRNSNNKQVYGFLYDISANCGGNLMALPLMYGIEDDETLEKMFSVIPFDNVKKEDTSVYVFLYSYKVSENLNIGYGVKDDSFLIKSECDLLPSSLSEENGNSIPAFGVTFAKQNQAFFKSLSLKSEKSSITDTAINKTLSIASKASEGPRETTTFGQDIYSIYSSYQYKCEVTMMGNAQIMPLMYFQLNNVPFWKGTYMIISVNHEITAGNMITKFVGVRVNRNTIPIFDGKTAILKTTGESVIKALPVNNNDYNVPQSFYYPYSNLISIKNHPDFKTAKKAQKQIEDSLGWKNYMSAALIGCIFAEAGGINPSSVNIGEKGGTLITSMACYRPSKINSEYNYGAGIIQWSFLDRKIKALSYIAQEDKGLIHGMKPLEFLKDCDPKKPTTPNDSNYKGGVENLSVEEQVKMIIGELKNEYHKVNESMLLCDTIEEAVAVVFCDYLGGFSNEVRIPSPDEVNKKVKKYMIANNTRNDAPFYKKRLGFAKNFV